jgi:hypothetical protein
MSIVRQLYDELSSRSLDFLMLFLAVTLGFVAENYREAQVIEANLQQNYATMLDELRNDREQIDRIYAPHEAENRDLMRLEYLMYQYQNGKIDYDSLVDGALALDSIPSYPTVFINNATYKSIQAMGYMASIPNDDLKLTMSHYYETMTKRLEDNNKLFDQEGADFFNNDLPVLKLVWLRGDDALAGTKHPTDTAFNDLKTYQRWVLMRPETKAYLSSVRAIHDVESFRSRFLVYCYAVSRMRVQNDSLSALLEAVRHE